MGKVILYCKEVGMDIVKLIGFFVCLGVLYWCAKWLCLSVLAPFGHWLGEYPGGQLFLVAVSHGRDINIDAYAFLGAMGCVCLLLCISLPLSWYIKSLRGRVRANMSRME